MIPPVLQKHGRRDTHYLEINGALPLCNPRDLLLCDLLEGLEKRRRRCEVLNGQVTHTSEAYLLDVGSGLLNDSAEVISAQPKDTKLVENKKCF